MSPGGHLLASWLVANGSGFEHRERRLVAFAGLAPDLDGFGYLVDRYNEFMGADSFYYVRYHHVIGHNLQASVVIAAFAAWLAGTRRAAVFVASLAVAHLHFLCDVAGSRGPDGYQWPIPYLYPFSEAVQWTWSGQWELSAWPNTAITLAMLAACIAWSAKQRYSFVEVISAWLDREFFRMVARRFGG